MRVLAAAIVVALVAGCDNGPSSTCSPQAEALGRCTTASASPTPGPPQPPPQCDFRLCPFTLSWTYPFADEPLIALVSADPSGAFTLQVNGVFQTFPAGLARVRQGDIVTGTRCCGSTIQYVVL